MPITVADAPNTLPAAGKKLYVGAFNGAYTGTCKDEGDRRDECARRIAWKAVKNKYKKKGDKWVAKAALVEIDLLIVKASLQDDGTMRWLCTASDTDIDNRQDHTTIQLFNDWIHRVENDVAVSFLPPPCMPFLGLSHYPRLDGFGEAGTADRLYIDGNQFKAGGMFFDRKLGREMFEAVRAELAAIKQGDVPDLPIRISAAWWDVEHAHGDFRFRRTDLDEVCPMCLEDASKTFLRGQLDHFAGTRVPINPRTSLSLGLEEKSMAITREEDAASIVSAGLAKELEEKTQERMQQRSETDGEETPPALVVKAADAEPSGVGEAEPSGADAGDVAPDETADAGDVERADAAGPEDQGEAEPDADAEGAEEEQQPAVLEEQHTVEVVEVWRPFGGATSIADAEDWMAAQERMYQMYDSWSLFRAVVENILDDEELENKIAAVRKAISEFGDRVDTIKSEATDAFLARAAVVEGDAPMTEKTEKTQDETQTVQTEETPPVAPIGGGGDALDPGGAFWHAVDAFASNVTLSRAEMLERAQKAMDTLAQATHNLINQARPPQAGGEEMKAMVEGAVTAAVGPLAEQVALLLARSQAAAAPAMPVQKSFVAPVGQVPANTGIPTPAPVSNIRALARRSVGLPA